MPHRPLIFAVLLIALPSCGLINDLGGDVSSCSCDTTATNSRCIEMSGGIEAAAQVEAACNTTIRGVCEFAGDYSGSPCPTADRVATCESDTLGIRTAKSFYGIGDDPYSAQSDFSSDCEGDGLGTAQLD